MNLHSMGTCGWLYPRPPYMPCGAYAPLWRVRYPDGRIGYFCKHHARYETVSGYAIWLDSDRG